MRHGDCFLLGATVMNPSPKRILLIDDERSVTQLVRLALTRSGEYRVKEENNSRVALQTARRFRPDLVFLDVMMPGFDGGDVVRLLGSDPLLCDTPVVFLTSLVPEAETPLGIFGHRVLSKPLNLEAVERCAREVLAEADAVELVA